MGKKADINLLIYFYNTHQRSPGKRDIRSYSTFVRSYGSWNAALQAAGLPLNRKSTYSRAELIISIRRYIDENGRNPTANDCNITTYMFDSRTYLKNLECKTWPQVLRKAGVKNHFDPSTFRAMPDNELLSLVRLVLSPGNDTTFKFYNANKKNLPNSRYLFSRFGGWRTVLKKCGFSQTRKNTVMILADLYFTQVN